MKSYEERVSSLLSSWWDSGESWESIREELVELTKEEYNRGYAAGYSFAKEETKKIAELVEVLSD